MFNFLKTLNSLLLNQKIETGPGLKRGENAHDGRNAMSDDVDADMALLDGPRAEYNAERKNLVPDPFAATAQESIP